MRSRVISFKPLQRPYYMRLRLSCRHAVTLKCTTAGVPESLVCPKCQIKKKPTQELSTDDQLALQEANGPHRRGRPNRAAVSAQGFFHRPGANQ